VPGPKPHAGTELVDERFVIAVFRSPPTGIKKASDQVDKGFGVFLVTLPQKCLETVISSVTGQESGFRITVGFWASRGVGAGERWYLHRKPGLGRGQLNFLVFCSGCDTLPEAIPWTSTSIDVACA